MVWNHEIQNAKPQRNGVCFQVVNVPDSDFYLRLSVISEGRVGLPSCKHAIHFTIQTKYNNPSVNTYAACPSSS